MLENIAIIKEVHFWMNTKEAQLLAKEFLDKIGLVHIGEYRLHQCSLQERFFVILIRALMTKEKKIIIKMPYAILYNLRDMRNICQKIDSLNSDKDIIILDTFNNEINYKEALCNIIK